MADAGSMSDTNPNDDNFLPEFGELSKDDRKNLVLMVTALQNSLKHFVINYNELVPQFPEFNENFTESWKEVNGYFKDLKFFLENTPRTHLTDEGLTGEQLRLKFLLLQSAYNETKEYFEDFLKSDEEQKHKEKSWWKNALDGLFNHGNSVLGSLGDAGLPFVGAIGEFKDGAETIMKRNKKSNNLPVEERYKVF